MSNYAAITGSSKIVHRNQGGGSKLQGIPSSTNLNTWAHVAFRNRNVVCPCNRNLIFCMNQLGGVGAGGIPGRSYAFAPTADGTHKQFYCNHRFVNGKWLIYPKKDKDGFTTIAKYPDSNISILIGFNDIGDQSNTVTFFTTTNIPKGTTYKLKGTGIEETIFTVEGLIFTVEGLDKSSTTGYINYYNVSFDDPNINSGKIFIYYRYNRDPLFELSAKE